MLLGEGSFYLGYLITLWDYIDLDLTVTSVGIHVSQLDSGGSPLYHSLILRCCWLWTQCIQKLCLPFLGLGQSLDMVVTQRTLTWMYILYMNVYTCSFQWWIQMLNQPTCSMMKIEKKCGSVLITFDYPVWCSIDSYKQNPGYHSCSVAIWPRGLVGGQVLTHTWHTPGFHYLLLLYILIKG